MNRREFCQTAGLLLAGPIYSCAVTVRAEDGSNNFRIKKVFLESWDAEIVHRNSRQSAAFVRERLDAIHHDGCDGLLFFPGRCSVSRWTKWIEPDANRLGLTVFVPACLTVALFRKAQTVQRINDEGFLLLDGFGNGLGLILYDVSRCRWTGFMPSGVDAVQDSEHSPLTTAQWLDFTLHRFHENRKRADYYFSGVKK